MNDRTRSFENLLARMVRDFFHRDARDFECKLRDVLSDGRLGYALYEFSYFSKIPGAEGRRVGFSGVSCCALMARPYSPRRAKSAHRSQA